MWKSSFIIAIAVFVTACGRIPTAPTDSDRQDAVVQQASEVDNSRGGKEHQSTFHCEDESIDQQVSKVDDSKGGKEFQVSFQCTENAVEGSVTR